jgi:hypothetical protein
MGHLEVLVGDVVTIVVLRLVVMPHVASVTGKVAGDDVPSDPTVREVVEGRHPAGERKRMLVAGAAVIPNPRSSVTWAIAETRSAGSFTGTWAPCRMAASLDPP